MNKIPIIVILGPTAIGKTDIAIQLAKKLNAEVVSADSMQVYKYMDIGTAKPTMEERQGIPHHMIDVVEPDTDFNVSIYKEMAEKRINEIAHKGNPVIVAGGTGLYINSLIQPVMTFTEAGMDRGYRRELEKKLELKGNKWLHQQLIKVDSKTGSKLHLNDTRRIIRALEVHHLTGKPISEHHKVESKIPSPYTPILIGLNMNRNNLYDRINTRVDRMIDGGLIQEVHNLLKRGYNRDLNSMKGLGYKEIIQYLQGYRTIEEAIYILKRDTRRFAKRQLTWFYRLSNVFWIDMGDYSSKEDISNDLLTYIRKSESFKY